MHLGTRRIRSAGRNSGSIELTLPARLQDLEGVPCRLVVRDGPRPEIVLQPDLSAAYGLFAELWERLRQGLGNIDDIGELSLSDLSVSLLPTGRWGEPPPLACADALAVLRARRAGAPQAAQEPLARLVAGLAAAAAARLGLRGTMALAFGEATAYLATGAAGGHHADFERAIAHQLVGLPVGAEDAHLPDLWERLRPGLARLYAQLAAWQDDEAAHAAARSRWQRAAAALAHYDG